MNIYSNFSKLIKISNFTINHFKHFYFFCHSYHNKNITTNQQFKGGREDANRPHSHQVKQPPNVRLFFN